jgi:hypothetical protein
VIARVPSWLCSATHSPQPAAQDFSGSAPKLTTNMHLQLASTFFGLQEIANQVSASRPKSGPSLQPGSRPPHTPLTVEAEMLTKMRARAGEGITMLEAPTFVTADPHTPNLRPLLQQVYVLYCDFVLKNPFHQADMPIRSELFDTNLSALIQRARPER